MIKNCFDRPIFILSAPRSGSTLLYEVLSKNSHLLSIGGESHAIIESTPGLNIAARNFESNALGAKDATPKVADTLYKKFRQNLKSSKGNAIDVNISDRIRFLEKTPKNSLRIEFLNHIFPDALFIYLVRDPKDNISSIMQAWRSNRFVTYPRLPGWNGDWSLLLPNNWNRLLGEPLQNIAAFQWCEANDSIIKSLSQLPNERWSIVKYEDLISHTSTTLKAICQFCQIPFDEQLEFACSKPLPHSQYTLSVPKKDKWLSNYTEIESIWTNIQPSLKNINTQLKSANKKLLSDEWQEQPVLSTHSENKKASVSYNNISRNMSCPCGSNKRFKHCHGQLN